MTARFRSNSTATRLLLAAILMVIMGRTASAAPDPGPPAQPPCPPHEEIFLSNGYNPAKPYGYRLIIHEGPDDSIHTTIDEPWVIQTFDRKTGKVMSELLLKRSCSVGRRNCKVGPHHGWGISAVEEIGIDADFKPVKLAPHAIIIPRFIDWIWPLLTDLSDTKDLKVWVDAPGTPDLSDELIWAASCSDTSSGR